MISTKVVAICGHLTVKHFLKMDSSDATSELANMHKQHHPNWASCKCCYFATGNHNDKTTQLGDWLSILDFLAAEEVDISFYMSAKESATSSKRDTNAHLQWYNKIVASIVKEKSNNILYKILFYMDFLSTWDDSTAKLLKDKFPPSKDTMFRAVIHALIFSEKVYFSSNGSSNYKSLPPPPTPAPSLALPTPAVAPPTPAVGRALSTAVTPDNSTTRSGASIRHLPDNADEADKKEPKIIRTTYGLT
jgi:hypothetical protein